MGCITFDPIDRKDDSLPHRFRSSSTFLINCIINLKKKKFYVCSFSFLFFLRLIHSSEVDFSRSYSPSNLPDFATAAHVALVRPFPFTYAVLPVIRSYSGWRHIAHCVSHGPSPKLWRLRVSSYISTYFLSSLWASLPLTTRLLLLLLSFVRPHLHSFYSPSTCFPHFSFAPSRSDSLSSFCRGLFIKFIFLRVFTF